MQWKTCGMAQSLKKSEIGNANVWQGSQAEEV
jgi:hypothetical protein